MSDHITFQAIMKKRIENIRILQSLWSSCRYRELLQHCSEMNDAQICYDFLVSSESVWLFNNGLLTLDLVVLFIPLLHQLLTNTRMIE